MIRAQVVGATGYGGLGIIELFLRHPEIEIGDLLAKNDVGRPLSDFFPHLRGFCDRVVEDASEDRIGRDCDLVVFATPDRVGMQYAARALERGAAVLDYSGDFRFGSPERYSEYARRHPSVAGRPHEAPGLLGKAVYGLPELFRERIKGARLVGNPGCFAVAMILSLAPALTEGLVDPASIIVDGKTGISGAGKKPGALYHFPDRDGNLTPYRVGTHQHVVETVQALSSVAGTPVKLTFVPHLAPVSRGILTTAYAVLRRDVDAREVDELYRTFYANEPFVRIQPLGSMPSLKTVVGSNLCDLAVAIDQENGRLIVVGAIDNLLKGQAGTAMQNINLMFGFPETAGLERTPVYP
ncbi:MAG TPA: N-acetyl-gamma-glutamyl-phosphate reductase [Chloroflexota bacterium]|nr:N-acetyl-gamma-glutamyl-phosphate reductase [Chloroflexota bacterium]